VTVSARRPAKFRATMANESLRASIVLVTSSASTMASLEL